MRTIKGVNSILVESTIGPKLFICNEAIIRFQLRRNPLKSCMLLCVLKLFDAAKINIISGISKEKRQKVKNLRAWIAFKLRIF